MRRTTGDPAAGGRSPANMDGRGEDDASSFMELGGDDEAPVEDPEEGGDGPGESELGEDDVIDTEAEGDLPGAGVGVMAFLPGAGIGPMGLEALDTSHERMEAAREEGGAHARRCFEVETTVRKFLAVRCLLGRRGNCTAASSSSRRPCQCTSLASKSSRSSPQDVPDGGRCCGPQRSNS